MDKFIIRATAKADGYRPCNIDVATHEKLLQIKEDTGVSIAKIVAQIVEFCMERLEIQED